jgi:hypothetical protein
MNCTHIIFDNFYQNPDEIREYALGLDFNVKGNYPGARTTPEGSIQRDYLKQYFEEHIVKQKITTWDSEYNTSFQFTTEKDTTWVHHDSVTNWAAVLYLTPDAPIESGTGIYKNIESGVYLHSPDNTIDYNDNEDCRDLTKWKLIDQCANIYNRLFVYNANLYHRSIVPGFGKDKEDGRLFQTFFFNT